MFLRVSRLPLTLWGFLCTCRDVSDYLYGFGLLGEFSLHMQRCFQKVFLPVYLPYVFSAHAEMFRSGTGLTGIWLRFLCTCRDVSPYTGRPGKSFPFSLHMQRCFPLALPARRLHQVFSAHAEMFPHDASIPNGKVGFLCTCRDVSFLLELVAHFRRFSLHMQRCFHLIGTCSYLTISFLCTCRDVSGCS